MPKFVFIRNIRRTSLKKLSQTCLLEHNLSLLAPGPIRWKFCTLSKNAHKEIHVLLTSTKIIPGACERDFRILCVVIQCACMCGRGVGSKIAKTNIHLKYPVGTKKNLLKSVVEISFAWKSWYKFNKLKFSQFPNATLFDIIPYNSTSDDLESDQVLYTSCKRCNICKFLPFSLQRTAKHPFESIVSIFHVHSAFLTKVCLICSIKRKKYFDVNPVNSGEQCVWYDTATRMCSCDITPYWNSSFVDTCLCI